MTRSIDVNTRLADSQAQLGGTWRWCSSAWLSSALLHPRQVPPSCACESARPVLTSILRIIQTVQMRDGNFVRLTERAASTALQTHGLEQGADTLPAGDEPVYCSAFTFTPDSRGGNIIQTYN